MPIRKYHPLHVLLKKVSRCPEHYRQGDNDNRDCSEGEVWRDGKQNRFHHFKFTVAARRFGIARTNQAIVGTKRKPRRPGALKISNSQQPKRRVRQWCNQWFCNLTLNAWPGSAFHHPKQEWSGRQLLSIDHGCLWFCRCTHNPLI